MPSAETKYPLSIVVSAIDRLSSPMRRISGQIDRVVKPLERLRGKLRLEYRATGIPKILTGMRNVGSATFGVVRETGGLIAKFALVGAAGAAAGFAILRSYSAAGDEIANTSLRLGIGTRKLQQWRFAAESAGVGQATFDMAMQRLGRRAAEAAVGMGEGRLALAALGIDARRADGRLKGLEELLPEIADGMAGIDDAGARNAIAMKLFDSEGVALVQMLGDGAKGLRDMESQADSLGAVISAKAIAQMKRFIQVLTNLEASLTVIPNVIGEEVLPVVSDYFERSIEWITQNQSRLREYVQQFLAGLPARIEMLKARAREFWVSLQPLIERLGVVRNWLAENGRWVDLLKVGLAALAAVLAGPLLVALAMAGKAVLALSVMLLTTPVGWIITAIGLIVLGLFWLGSKFEWVGNLIDYEIKRFVSLLTWLKDTALGIFEVIGGWWDKLFGADGKVEMAVSQTTRTQEDLARRGFDPQRIDLGELATPPAAAPLEGGRSEVVVRFEDVPDGARVEQSAGGTAPLSLDVGYAIPGVSG